MNVKFEDGFPFSQDDLKLREKLKTFYGLPIQDEVERNIGYVPVGGLSIEEELLRKEMKRKQAVLFNEQWQAVKRAVVKLKAYRMPEKEIVKQLEKDKVYTVNGKPVSQSTINKQYHEYLEVYENLQLPENSNGAEMPLHTSINADLSAGIGPHIDTSRLAQKNRALPEPFERIIKIPFKKGTIGEGGIYLDIMNRNQQRVETLYFPSAIITADVLNIKVIEDTVLIPGYYTALFYRKLDSGKKMEQPSDAFSFTVGQQFMAVPGVSFVQDYRGGYLPTPSK